MDFNHIVDIFFTSGHYMSNIVVHDCSCYNEYLNLANLIAKKQSYLACTMKDNNIYHKTIPIQIGSLLDLIIHNNKIKGSTKIEDVKHQVGFYIINGDFVNIPGFWANNTNGLHCTTKLTKKQKPKIIIEWNLQHKGKIINITYDEELVAVERNYDKKIDKQSTNQETRLSSKDVLKIMNEVRAKLGIPQITLQEFIDQIIEMKQHPLDLDSLANKVILSSSKILHKAYVTSMVMDKNITPLKSSFLRGTLYFVLRKEGSFFNFTNQNNKSLYGNQGGSGQNNAILLTTLVRRGVTDSAKKSKALLYPPDGEHFLCPINSKELEGVGEVLGLSVGVIISVPTNITKLYNFICNGRFSGEYKIMLDNFIINNTISLDSLLLIKQKFPMVSFLLFGNIIKIQTSGDIPMKFCCTYLCFISPFEKTHIWKDAFNQYSSEMRFDINSQFIRNLYSVPPSKVNVTRANNKNKSCWLTREQINKREDLNTKVFFSSGGTHSAVIKENYEKTIHRPLKNLKNYTCVDIANFDYKKEFESLKCLAEKHNLSFMTKNSVNKIKTFKDYIKFNTFTEEQIHNVLSLSGDSSEEFFKNNKNDQWVLLAEKIHTIYFKLLQLGKAPENIIVSENLGKSCTPIKTTQTKINKKNIKFFNMKSDKFINIEPLLSIKNRADEYFHDYVYVAFGDICGGTVEDGIIIDKEYMENSPKKLINTAFRITIKKYNDTIVIGEQWAKKNIIYAPQNKIIGGEILFGHIYSPEKLTFTANLSIMTEETATSECFIYSISCICMLDNITIKVESYNRSGFIFANYYYEQNIGIGAKIANFFGQKNIICKVEDLHEFGGYTNYGRFVKPAFLYAIQSLLGRFSGNQALCGIDDKHVAINKFGGLVVPIPVIFHEIVPTSKIQDRPIRIDLWTDVNGFIANSLTSHTLISKYKEHNGIKNNENVKTLLSLNSFAGTNITIMNRKRPYSQIS